MKKSSQFVEVNKERLFGERVFSWVLTRSQKDNIPGDRRQGSNRLKCENEWTCEDW